MQCLINDVKDVKVQSHSNNKDHISSFESVLFETKQNSY